MNFRGSMKKLYLLPALACALCLLPLTPCNAEETKTVDWYAAPENKAALDAKLAECKNNPGELKDTPNCINAWAASEKLAISGKFEKVQEPPIPTFGKP